MSDIRPGSERRVPVLEAFATLCESATPALRPRLKDIQLLGLFRV